MVGPCLRSCWAMSLLRLGKVTAAVDWQVCAGIYDFPLEAPRNQRINLQPLETFLETTRANHLPQVPEQICSQICYCVIWLLLFLCRPFELVSALDARIRFR